MTAALAAALLPGLSAHLCLGPGMHQGPAGLRADTPCLLCRRLLREEVTSGRLDAAPSKAAVLQGLCDTVKLQPEVAQALHKSLYKQKLDSLLEDKKLSGEGHLLN